MKYYYMAIVLKGEPPYAVFSPDFPEAHTQGHDLAECMDMAAEVLKLTVDEYRREGRSIPEPCDLPEAKARVCNLLDELACCLREHHIHYQLVGVPVGDEAARRKLTRLPRHILKVIDAHANACGMSRADFLASEAVRNRKSAKTEQVNKRKPTSNS